MVNLLLPKTLRKLITQILGKFISKRLGNDFFFCLLTDLLVKEILVTDKINLLFTKR